MGDSSLGQGTINLVASKKKGKEQSSRVQK